MDSLFATSTSKTVWQTLIKRRPMEELLQERRQEFILHGKSEEAGLEQLELVDSTRKRK